MKDFLIAIIILLILVSAFGTIDSRIEFEYPFGNWAVPGNTGQPVPGDGEPGNSNVFSFGSAEQTQGTQENTQEDTQGGSPITVTMVTEKAEKESVLAWVLFGVSAAILAGVYVFTVCAYAQYFKERRRSKP